jgi:hypothetical protein
MLMSIILRILLVLILNQKVINLRIFSILKNAKNHTLENITENALIDLMDNIDTLKTLKIDSYKYENDDETITEIYINISY